MTRTSPASSVEVTIPVSSVHTSSDKLDEHLQSSDFFNVDKWPDIHFKSTHVEAGATRARSRSPETSRYTA